jgi:hypothetical protein
VSHLNTAWMEYDFKRARHHGWVYSTANTN